MYRKSIFLLMMMAMAVPGLTQTSTPRQPLPRHINVPGKNHVSPALSGDGKTLVYFSNYTNSGKMLMMYSNLNSRGEWSEAKELTTVNREGQDFIGGQFLSYDGKTLFFTSKRVPGIGGYDIFFSERQGKYWTPPQNIGKPVNSAGNEGHASLSPDGKYLYFMRCQQMNNYKVDQCELFVAERRSQNYWNEPVKLPYPVNAGNEATPKILSDGISLIFASKRSGSRGGYDLYQTTNQGDSWSLPVSLDYLNTEEDDQFVSVPAHNELIYYSATYRDKYNIIKAKIPENLQANNVVLAQGKLVDKITGKPLTGIIQIYQALSQERDQFLKTDDKGNFYAMIRGDNVYDFSIITPENDYFYYASFYDLAGLDVSKIEDLEISLEPVKKGHPFVCSNIRFLPYSSNLDPVSEIATKRLIKFLKDNRVNRVEVAVHTDEVIRDTIPSDPDLTEMIIDSLLVEPLPVDLVLDSLNQNVSLSGSDSILVALDTMMSDTFRMESPQYELKYTYHNDRTQKQAETLVDRLISLGVPSHLLEARGYGDQQPLLPNNSPENRMKNKRIEIRIY